MKWSCLPEQRPNNRQIHSAPAATTEVITRRPRGGITTHTTTHHPRQQPPNQRSLARSLGNGKRTSIRESAFSLLLYCSHVHPEQLLQRPFQFNPAGPNPRHLLLPLLLLLLRRAYSPPRSRSGGTVGAQKRTKRQLPLLLLVLLPRDNTTATEYPFHPTPNSTGRHFLLTSKKKPTDYCDGKKSTPFGLFFLFSQQSVPTQQDFPSPPYLPHSPGPSSVFSSTSSGRISMSKMRRSCTKQVERHTPSQERRPAIK